MNVLVAGWIGSTNLGDELVFAGLRRLLADRNVEVVAFSRDAAATRRVHGVTAIERPGPRRLLAAAGDADALVFGGGGLLQDITSPLNLPYHLARTTAARLRRTPFAAVGLGVGGLETRIGHWQVRRAMAHAVGITVRDRASQELLARVGVPDAALTADLAFALADGRDDAAPAEPATLAVCLRPWGGGRSRLPAQARGDATPQHYVDALAIGLDQIAASSGLAVRFVAFQRDRDDDFHARVAARMTSPSTRCAPDLDGVLDEVAAATAVVSMRYHGGVAAVLAGRPVVLIDYALKVASLAEELGDAGRLLAWDRTDLARLPAAFAQVVDRGSDVVAVRDRLVTRQRGNGAVLDDLLRVAAG